MSRKRVHTAVNLAAGRVVKVYKDSEYGEYICRLYTAESGLYEPADYFTDSLSDAKGTAALMVKPIYRHIPTYEESPNG